MSCLQDIVDVVNSSADVNTAQLVGTEDGEILVPTYAWDDFLREHFRKLPGIKSYHHFVLSASSPGVVTLKTFSDSTASTFTLVYDDDNWAPTAEELPPIVQPSGLSNTRQWYLYKQIREFCRAGTEDRVCPLPSVPPEEEELEGHSNEPREDEGADENVPRRATQVRRCGRCGAAGHNRRTCSVTV